MEDLVECSRGSLFYGIPWTILLPCLFMYMTWHHTIAVGAFLCSTSVRTRNLTLFVMLRACQFWYWLRSFALVRVTWRETPPSLFQQPVIRFLVGYGGGGRTCGSLVVY